MSDGSREESLAPHKKYMGEAMKHPEAVFKEPQEIMKDNNLTYKEKLRVLENWSDEVRHVLESGAENMNPGVTTVRENELLRKISTMIAELKEKNSD